MTSPPESELPQNEFPESEFRMSSPIARLIEFGQSPWYDNLTRPLARGGLTALVNEHGIRGVTSNPTIFEKAMATGSDYDAQLRELVAAGHTTEAAYWALVERDIADAADVLAPFHESWGGADGFVSIEVDPDLAHDTEGTLAQAKELFARLQRPNVMIKIPATREGLPAITEAIAAGLNVNITLIFALERYQEVIEAYLEGLEQRVDQGEPVTGIASVASFFVSRVDTETDRRLPEGHPLRGRAAVANAKLAYEVFLDRFAGPRWEDLAAAGARLQRPLWASTSTKNPAYSPTLYVDELIGADTVNTLAQASIDALAHHEGFRPNTVREGVDRARKVIADLRDAGVDFDDVTATLEREGVASFSASYHDALSTLEKKTRELK
jgi:transaldolase